MLGTEVLRLGADMLLRILQYLDAESLASLCCTCRELKIAAGAPSIWKALANERWHYLHAASFAAEPRGLRYGVAPAANTQGRVNWKSLFVKGNGWEPRPRLCHTAKLRCPSSPLALQPLWVPASLVNCTPTTQREGLGGGEGLVIAIGREDRLDLLYVGLAAFKFTVDPGGAGASTAARQIMLHGSCPPGPTAGGGDAASSLGLPAACGNRTVDPCNSKPANNKNNQSSNSSSSSLDRQADRNVCSREVGIGGRLPVPGSSAAASGLLSSLTVADGASSVAWIVSGYGGPAGPGPANSRINGSSSRSSSGREDTMHLGGTGSSASAPRSAAGAGGTTAIMAAEKITLAVGTRRGKVEWYQYDDDVRRQGFSYRRGGGNVGCSREPHEGGALRLLSTTDCGSPGPLVELHLLPSSSAATAATTAMRFSDSGGGGGLMAALQLGWGAFRSAVHLYDVASQRHLSTVREPFESHQFVCCRPAGGGDWGSGVAANPHVLLVGSVHGGVCAHCAVAPLPSLCSHKPRSSTAALYTLDVRCGLTQRFGLQHSSLYPRLATAREHYVFTSHAGTALEVYDRRAMSVPLYSCARLPWPPPGLEGPESDKEAEGEVGGEDWEEGYREEADEVGGAAEEALVRGEAEEHLVDGLDVDALEENGEEEEEEGINMTEKMEGGPGCIPRRHDPSERGDFPGWRNLPAAAANRHKALWLESNGDVLVGRSDNGTLWLWDLSTVLGWARGPDRSGLWHWMYEHGPLDLAEEVAVAHAAGPTLARGGHGHGHRTSLGQGLAAASGVGEALSGGVGCCWGSVDCGVGFGFGVPGPGGQDTAARRVRGAAAAALGEPVCLGSVACRGATPVFALATGATTAFFSLGEGWGEGSSYVVGSVVA